DLPPNERLLLPCLPNRFVAIVPWGSEGAEARKLADACQQQCRHAWQTIWSAVLSRLDEKLKQHIGWARSWKAQVESCFEIRTVVLPERQCREAEIGRLLAADGKFTTALPRAAAVRELDS